MYSKSGNSNASWSNGLYGYNIKVDDVYIKYDGPVLFKSKIGMEDYLIYKIDEDDDDEVVLYGASSIDEKTLKLLVDNQISIRGALCGGDFVLIKCDYDLTIKEYSPFPIEDLLDDMLPAKGKPISFSIKEVPDSIDQLDSYFSIRLSGEKIKKDSMSLSSFKKLVDRSYVAIKSILTPPDILGSKGRFYDFMIGEPQFGSLVINVKKRIIVDNNKFNEYINSKSIDINKIESYERDFGSEFYNNLNDLKKNILEGNLNKEFISKNIFFIRKINEVIPNEDDIYSDVDFIFRDNGERVFFHLSENESKAISKSYKEYIESPVSISGIIKIVNDSSKSIVLAVDFHKDVTCSFGEEHFSKMKETYDLKIGKRLKVTGIIKSRKMRDYLKASERGIVID